MMAACYICCGSGKLCSRCAERRPCKCGVEKLTCARCNGRGKIRMSELDRELFGQGSGSKDRIMPYDPVKAKLGAMAANAARRKKKLDSPPSA